GTVVVMNRAGGSVSLLTGADRIDVEVGPELGGLALSPGGGLAFVKVSSAAHVAAIDISKGAVGARGEVARLPWAIAVTDDGDDDDFDETVLVAHRQAWPRAVVHTSPSADMEGWVSELTFEPSGAGETSGHLTLRTETPIVGYEFGFPNQL